MGSPPANVSTHVSARKAHPSKLSAVILAAQVLERLFGLFLTVAIAQHLGAGREIDIALLALVVPTTVGDLLETISYVSLLPFFARARVAEGRGGEWQFANRVLNTATPSFLLLLVVYAVLSPAIARDCRHQAIPPTNSHERPSGGSSTPSMLLRGLGGTLAAYLMNNDRVYVAFGRVAVRGLHRLLLFVLMFRGGWGVTALVPATTLSDLVGVLFCLPATWRLKGGNRYILSSLLPRAALAEIVSQVGSQTLVGVLNASILVIERSMASPLPPGSIAILYYAPRGGTASAHGWPLRRRGLFPRFSQEAATRDAPLQRTVWLGLRAVIFMTVPVTVALLVVREPFVVFFYRRGEFTDADVAAVSSLMPFFLLHCVLGSVFYLASRALFSAMQAGAVARRELLSWVLYLAAAIGLTRILGIWGLAAAFGVRAVVSTILVLDACWRKRILAVPRPGRYVIQTALGAGLAFLGGSAGCWLGGVLVSGPPMLVAAAQVAGGSVGTVLGYLPICFTAYREETHRVLALLKRQGAGDRGERHGPLSH